MKKRILLSYFFLGFFLVLACDKQPHAAEVIQNCTGTYLKYHSKVYLVCNEEILSEYESGAKVRVVSKKIKKCASEGSQAMCEMIFPHDGAVEVLKVK